MANGFVLIARRLESSFLMDSPPLWLKLWIWMLLQARFRDGDNLKRGQLFTSIEKMRDAMAYMVGYRKQRPTKDQIRSAYEAFAKATMITTTKTTRGMIITICNYEKYQNPKYYEAHSETHDEGATKPTDTPHYNRRRGNEGKKKENIRDSLSTISRCPYQKILRLFSEILPELPEPNLDENLKKRIRARWKEKDRQTLEWWRWYFHGVSECDFLLGRKTDFAATLHWLTGPQNMSKVLNGQYLNRKPMTQNQQAGMEFLEDLKNG